MFPTRYAAAAMIMVRSILGIQDLPTATSQQVPRSQVINNAQQNVSTVRTSRKRKFEDVSRPHEPSKKRKLEDVSRRHEPVKISRREKVRRVAERKANRSESPLRFVTTLKAAVPVQPAPVIVAETRSPSINIDSVSRREIRRVVNRKEQQMRREERMMRDAGGVASGTSVEESS